MSGGAKQEVRVSQECPLSDAKLDRLTLGGAPGGELAVVVKNFAAQGPLGVPGPTSAVILPLPVPVIAQTLVSSDPGAAANTMSDSNKRPPIRELQLTRC